MNFAHPLMDDNISRADLDTLIEYLQQENPRLTHGEKVRDFEDAWSSWLGTNHSVMVNSGSSANDLTMDIVADVRGPGEVIVPPLTWVSDIAAILRAGLKPRFVDINIDNLALDADKVRDAVGPSTVGIFLTHVLGLNGITEDLLEVAHTAGIPLIEDCCESHGAQFQGRKVGSVGWISNFSFYYAHHLSTIEGGMICSNDEEVMEQARMRRSHGLVREASEKVRNRWKENYPDLNPDFIFAYPSHNMRPTELQGVIGLSQLGRLDGAIEKRKSNFRFFMKNLDPERFYTHFDSVDSSNYAFIIVQRKPDMALRNRIEKNLRDRGIEFRRGLSGGGNQLRQPYLGSFEASNLLPDFKVVEHVHEYSWYVGNFPNLSEDRILTLIETLNEA